MTASNRVQAVIDEFVQKLTRIAREEAARVVLGDLAPAGRATSVNGASKRSLGGKRSPARLEALQQKVHGFIKTNPGLRIEQLNAKLGTTTKDLAGPIRKLIAAKALKTTGQRRATKYFIGGSKGSKSPTKKRKSK